MSKEGYVVYVLSAKPRNQPDADPRPLDDLDGKGLDLMTAVRVELKRLVLKVGPETEPRYENAYKFLKQNAGWSKHATFVQGEAGPYGATGRMVDIDDGAPQPFTSRQAAMVPLNGMIMRWPAGRFGLIFSERRSSRTLRKPIEEGLLKKIGRDAGVVFAVQSHIDPAAWEAFLEHAQVAEVRAVYRSTRAEDYVPDIRDRPGLTITAGGAVARRLGRDALKAAIRKSKGSGPGSVLLGELQPKQAADYERERVTIIAKDTLDQRTIDIEDGELPQWVYRTDKRLAMVAARVAWAEDARRLLASYNVDVPTGWQTL